MDIELSFNILSVNISKSIIQLDQLLHFLPVIPDIICIQEPPINSPTISGMIKINNPSNKVLVYTKSQPKSIYHDIFYSVITFSSFKIINCYFPPSMSHSSFEQALLSLTMTNSSSIIIGDFNAHHNSFTATSDIKGDILVNHCLSSNIDIQHPLFPTFLASTGSSTIDLVLHNTPCSINHSFPDLLSNFKSHHRPLLIECPLRNPPKFFVQHDWATFTLNLPPLPFYEFASPLVNQKDIETSMSSFISAIQFSATISSNYSQVKLKKPWWTPNLTALKAASISGGIIEYKAYKTAIQKAKRLFFRKQLVSMSENPSKSKVFKLLKPRNQIDPPTSTFPHYFSNTPPVSDLTPFLINPSSHLPMITPTDVINVIQKTDSKKATGIDNISVVMLKHLPQHYIHYLAFLLNSALHASYFPYCLKPSRVVFLDKHKPVDPLSGPQPSNFRPISITSTISRVYEKLILINLVRETDSMSPFQFGFAAGLTTAHAIKNVTDYIENKPLGKCVTTITTDFRSAFDTVTHEAILSALSQKHCPSNLISLVASYLKDRPVSFYSQTATLNRGVPQGGVISPFLFVATIDSLICDLSVDCHITAFADDLTIQFFSTVDAIVLRINSIVDTISSKANKLGLFLALDKCGFMLSYHNKIVINSPTCIPRIFQTKTLGLTFSPTLSLVPHFNEKKKKIFYFLQSFIKLARNSFGVRSCVRRMIYSTIIIPQLLYCPSIIEKYLNKSAMKIINNIHYIFARSTIKAFRSSPYNMVVPLSKIASPFFKLYHLSRSIITKYPDLSYQSQPIQPPHKFLPYEQWHDRLKLIFDSYEDLFEHFPNNPDYRLTQLFTQHNKSNYFISKFSDTNIKCRHCPQPESTAHILFYCPQYSILRKKYFNIPNIFPSYSILRDSKAATQFIIATRRFDI